MLRLKQTNSILFNKLKNMDKVSREESILNVVDIILQSLGLNDNPIINDITKQLKNKKYPSSEEIKNLKDIQEEYENEYFDKQEKNAKDYLVSFSKARAVNALLDFCMNTEESVYESAYEILITADDQEELIGRFKIK